MEINELQKQVKELFSKKHLPKQKKVHNTETTFVHLIEEIGEVSNELCNKRLGRGKFHLDIAKEELSDTLILTLQLANNLNINLEPEIIKKIKKIKKRLKIK